MAAPAILKIDIIADATKAIKAMGDTSDAAGGIGGSLKSVGKIIGPALGAGAILGFGKASVTAAQESEVANARLEQVFRSMGDASGDAAKGAANYASELSKKIGVEDESIMSAQAQLATFGAVSDETARQAGIFDRATAAAADLAAAGFGTLDSNSVQLGKALQDPEKGMTALAKSGVTFTDAQKDQIKALQESGDLLGAQKIVLGAVEGQVKGTAEATVTSQDKANVAFGELQETIGNKLLPVVSKLADLFTRYSGILIPIAGVIAAIAGATMLWSAAQSVASAATGVWSAIQAVFNAIMMANPIVLVVIAIAALVAAVILAYNKIGWFKDFVDSAFQGVVTAFNWIKDAAQTVFEWISDNWPILLAILTGPIGVAVLLITRNWDTIKDAAKATVDWVSDRFQDLTGFFSRIGGTISGIFSSIVDAIKSVMGAATDVYNWVTDKFNAIVDFLRGLVGSVKGIASNIADALKAPINAFIRAWNRIELTIPSVDIPLVGKVGGSTIGLPNIPELASGGLVMRTGLAMVHRGETFSGVGRSVGGNTTINVTVQTTGLGASSPEIQRAVVNALRGYTARNGALDLPVGP